MIKDLVIYCEDAEINLDAQYGLEVVIQKIKKIDNKRLKDILTYIPIDYLIEYLRCEGYEVE